MSMENDNKVLSGAIEDAYPLSPLQKGILFHSLVAQGSGAYIEQLLCDLSEAIDEVALQQAWRTIISRHPVLRTDFRWVDLVEPQQQVHTHVGMPWEQRDWRGISVAEQKSLLADHLVADRRSGFDMARAPLFRLTLIRRSDARYCLIWTFHHVLLDGRSLAPILREVFAYYEASQTNSALTLVLPRPYRDYIDWIAKQKFSKSENFWRRTLAGFTEPTALVVDHLLVTDLQSANRGGEQEIRLSAEITSALRSLAKNTQLTLSTIIQGAWSLVLCRYSSQNEVVFGITRDCRQNTIEGAEGIIGLCINTLPMRVRVNPEKSVIPWLMELRSQSLGMRAHEHTPLEQVQRWSDVPPGKSAFQSILVFENFELNELLQAQGGSWSNRQFRLFQQINYPVTLAVYAGTQLYLRIGFDRSRLDDAAAIRILGHLHTLLAAMAESPHRSLRDLPILTATERRQLLVEWNQTETEQPACLCAHELFEAQVERTPDAVAVEFGDIHLTYRELNSRSNQLAYFLQELGVGPEVLVGLCVHRSLEMIVGLFGVLKAGGAYVPVDPTYPPQRVAFMLEHADVRVVLTQRTLLQTLPPLKATEVICLDSRDWVGPVANIANPRHKAISTNLVYINYTSGSTGNPKGAMIPHRAIVNVMSWMQSAFPLDELDRVLQHISFSFDPSVLEILSPLLVGGRLVLTQPGRHQDPAYLVQTIIQHRITVLHVVPSMLRMLLQIPELKACGSLHHVFCGGESLTEDLVRGFFEVLDAELHHVYGPTEVAITSLFHSVSRNQFNGVIPIGRPVHNTQAYVLDGDRQPVPIGIPGELYLGGAQVGRGYYNDPGLTREWFVADPFRNGSSGQLYKTGDLVRYLPDGNIQFLGRLDHQVKIHGRRIELDEINSVIRLHPAVEESVVVVWENGLVAYVKPTTFVPALARELRRNLKDRLPTYMVPSTFVVLDAFPLTPSGKIDRAALPPPDPGLSESEALELFAPPQTPTEQTLVRIWYEFIKGRQIGIHDNFFEIGGDSLTMVAMATRINEVLNINLSVENLFQNPTVEKLATIITAGGPIITQRSGVFQLQQGQTYPSVYFINAGPAASRLAELMGDKHPIFRIQVPWPMAWCDAVANNQTSAFPRMDEIIAPYVAALSSHAGGSPCVIAGHSFAGLMAFEVARQFQSQGGEVNMVLLLDTWARYPRSYEVVWYQWRRDWMRELDRLPPYEISGSIGPRFWRSWLITQWSLRKVAKRVFGEAKKASVMFGGQYSPSPAGLAERLYSNILKSYHLRPLNSRGVLFRSESQDESPDERYCRGADPSLGWNSLFTRGFEIISVPGNHLSIMRQHNELLAQKITEVLRRY
jgi:amino acid adenylation domain-containing protein